MTIALLGFFFITGIIVIVVLIKLLRRKPKKPLRQGDYVMLRERYKAEFPGVPTSHAMVIEAILQDQAVVIFMTVKNQILKETIPLYALSRAS